MGMRLRKLELRVTTAFNPFGVTIPFEDGLTVLWAENTKGKSTCVLSILYALGLEGMLSPSHTPPLTGAMLDKIRRPDNENVPVVGSQVRLEIENDSKEVVTVHRFVKTDDPRERQLIHVEYGPAISKPGSYDRQDFYVRIGGAATNVDGFHNFLAKFIGYNLPAVSASDQRIVPLYMECFFPFFLVEQISGWRDIKARMPLHLSIPDMARRATEFVLDLDVLRREIQRQALVTKKLVIGRKWREYVESTRMAFSGSGSMIEGIPDEPPSVWPINPMPRFLHTDGESWFSYEEAKERYHRANAVIENVAIPQAEKASESLLREISDTEQSLFLQQQKLDELFLSMAAERSNVDAVDQRLNALSEDLRKYKSILKITSRSGLAKMPSNNRHCPTCKHEIVDAFLTQENAVMPMTTEDNILFLEDQISTFEQMRKDNKESLRGKAELQAAMERDMSELSSRLRAQKRTLRSDAETPSIAAIQEQLRIEQRLERLEELSHKAQTVMANLETIAMEWITNQSALKEVAKGGLSVDDKVKLDRLHRLYVEQLTDYGFSSYKLNEVGISPMTYRPTVVDPERPNAAAPEMGVTSASDAVRSVWAYLLAILEVSRSTLTNHVGFLIFDEPKQQSAKDVSFKNLLKRASSAGEARQQIICCTSEDHERLKKMLEGLPHKLLEYPEFILAPLPA